MFEYPNPAAYSTTQTISGETIYYQSHSVGYTILITRNDAPRLFFVLCRHREWLQRLVVEFDVPNKNFRYYRTHYIRPHYFIITSNGISVDLTFQPIDVLDAVEAKEEWETRFNEQEKEKTW